LPARQAGLSPSSAISASASARRASSPPPT
jgi:hypothetical protein